MRLRAAVHLHTTHSFDGRWPLEQLAAVLRGRGYDAMLTAEHSQSLSPDGWLRYQQACAALSCPEFLVVPGLEYRDADNVVHLPTWGTDLPHLGDGLHSLDLLTRVSECGGVAVLAHPGRRQAWQRVQPGWAPLLSGVEIWNRKYDGLRPGADGRLLAGRLGLPGIASLDFHRRRQLAPLATLVDVSPRAGGRVDATDVIAALRDGRVTAEFLGRPVTTWTHGAPGAALAGADTARRLAAAALRRVAP